ncbi:hypothetical protein COB21_04955, partial [Candidatus Aerophobetes bacterium]
TLYFKLFKSIQFIIKQISLPAFFHKKWRGPLTSLWQKLTALKEDGEAQEKQQDQACSVALQEALKAFEVLSAKSEKASIEEFKELRQEITVFAKTWEVESIGRRGLSVLSDKIGQVQNLIKERLLKDKKEKKQAKQVLLSDIMKNLETLANNVSGLDEKNFEEMQAKLVTEGQTLVSTVSQECAWELANFRVELTLIGLRAHSGDLDYAQALRTKFAHTVKEKIESYRKKMGGASIDIEKGLVYQEHRAALALIFNAQVTLINKIRSEIV